MVIRPAEKADRDSLVKLYLAMLVELEPLGNEMIASQRNAEIMVDAVLIPAARRGDGVMVAQAFHQVIGFAAFVQDPIFELRGAVAHGMYVDPDRRNASVCAELQIGAFRRLKRRGCKMVFGGALNANAAAGYAIRKLGATATGTTYTLDFGNLCLGSLE